MSQQRGEAYAGRPERGQSLDHVETRQLQAASEHGISRRATGSVTGGHAASLPTVTLATEGIEPDNTLATTSKLCCEPLPDPAVSVERDVREAMRRARLSEQAACDAMRLTRGQWSRQVRGVENNHLSMQRVYGMPPLFLQALVMVLAERLGLCVVRAEDVGSFIVRISVERRAG